MFNPAGGPQSQAAFEANQLISDHTSAYSSVDYLSNIQPQYNPPKVNMHLQAVLQPISILLHLLT